MPDIKTMLASKTKQALSSNVLQADSIKKNIIVLDELRELIPPLLLDEFNQLEGNILTHGCQTPIQLWQTTKRNIGLPFTNEFDDVAYVLIDGHNRYQICNSNNLPFEIYQLSFSDIKEAKDYMISLQLGRRNLSITQTAYFRGLRYNNEKADKYNNLPKGHFVPLVENEDNIPKGQNVPLGISTADRLAKEYNVNAKTIKRDADFANGLAKLTPEIRNQILSGITKIDKGIIQKLARDQSFDTPISDLSSLLILEKNKSQSVIQENIKNIGSLLNKFSKSEKKSDLESLIQAANFTLDLLN